jgi:type II secretory pathway predicted ATPase ExeA
MVTESIKINILQLIESESLRLGSYNKVAEKCGITGGTISFMRNRQDDKISDDMWLKVGSVLGLLFDNWEVVETASLRLVNATLSNAKEYRLFMAISDLAGTGKTQSTKKYSQDHRQNGVFYIECREWGKREFLRNLAQNLGISTARNFQSNDEMLMSIVEHFQLRGMQKPLLIIDEADKLKPAALRSIITMYNECANLMGMVICGTNNLKDEIKKGVKYNRKGYDEIDSRFGRNYISLPGATINDVAAICKANGIENTATIKDIFKQSGPVERAIGDEENRRFIRVVEDLRRVRRACQRELLKISAAAVA